MTQNPVGRNFGFDLTPLHENWLAWRLAWMCFLKILLTNIDVLMFPMLRSAEQITLFRRRSKCFG
jgi:hypothetical protein